MMVRAKRYIKNKGEESVGPYTCTHIQLEVSNASMQGTDIARLDHTHDKTDRKTNRV